MGGNKGHDGGYPVAGFAIMDLQRGTGLFGISSSSYWTVIQVNGRRPGEKITVPSEVVARLFLGLPRSLTSFVRALKDEKNYPRGCRAIFFSWEAIRKDERSQGSGGHYEAKDHWEGDCQRHCPGDDRC